MATVVVALIGVWSVWLSQRPSLTIASLDSTTNIPSTLSNNNFVIESIPNKVSVYQSPDIDPSLYQQIKNTFTQTLDPTLGTIYTHVYSFPDGDIKGAGLYFAFDGLVDWKDAYQFKAIEFTLYKSNPNDDIRLALSDGSENGITIILNTLSTSEVAGINITKNAHTIQENGVTISGDTYTISLAKNFPNVSHLKHVYFWIFPSGEKGTVQYSVSGLSFLK